MLCRVWADSESKFKAHENYGDSWIDNNLITPASAVFYRYRDTWTLGAEFNFKSAFVAVRLVASNKDIRIYAMDTDNNKLRYCKQGIHDSGFYDLSDDCFGRRFRIGTEKPALSLNWGF